MVFAVLAFLTVLFHLAFILFVIFGGFARGPPPPARAAASRPARRGARTSRSPIGSARSRRSRTGSGSEAGQAGYRGDVPGALPAGRHLPDRPHREPRSRALGVAVIVLNVGVYAWILRTRRRPSRCDCDTSGTVTSCGVRPPRPAYLPPLASPLTTINQEAMHAGPRGRHVCHVSGAGETRTGRGPEDRSPSAAMPRPSTPCGAPAAIARRWTARCSPSRRATRCSACSAIGEVVGVATRALGPRRAGARPVRRGSASCAGTACG